MLEKVLSLLSVLKTKNVLRVTLAVTAIASIVLGYVSFDGSSIAYKNTVQNVGVTLGTGSEQLDSTDIIETEDVVEPEENVTANENEELTLIDLNNAEYTLNPIFVTTVSETLNETVKHGYKKVYSDKLYKGESKITKGEHGEKKVTYTVTLVNGVEVNREVAAEEVIKEAVSQIETIGTKLHAAEAVMTSDDVDSISTLKPSKPIELDKDGKPVEYKKVITGKASAYCGHCDSNSTAYFGPNSARPGYVAVNPKQIPYGTKLYIVSTDGKRVYGYAIAADTGGFAHNGSKRVVDLRMDFDGNKCRCGSFWGVRNVNIFVLE